MDKRAGVTFFRRNFFVSQCRKKIWRNPSVLKRNPPNENFHAKEGGHHILSDIFLTNCTEKFRRADDRVSQMFWYGKENYS